jgi:HlyD family secretion protein
VKNKKLWIFILILILIVSGAGYIFQDNLVQLIGGQQLVGQASAQAARGQNTPDLTNRTTPIRSAAGSTQVSAAGNIDVVTERPVILQVEGTVMGVAVQAGDSVAFGDPLVTLDTASLERAVTQAELNLAASQLQLEKLNEEADPAEVASAQANLASAQENLRDVQAGPSEAELAAAEANLASAQQHYQELLAGPSEAELVQLKASMEKASITLQQAQGDYNKIAYTDSVGASPQAAALQQATIDYESAKAAYEVATEPAAQSDLQDALGAIQSAQDQLDTLRAQPTAAELTAAEAQVASAAAQLEALLAGPSETDLKEAQISVDQSQLALDEAKENLAQAQLLAPIDGTILTVDVAEGQKAAAGTTALTMADLTALKLTVNVAEVDISKIQYGQSVKITIDALPEQVFNGLVTQIAPASDSEQGVVNYPVTIQLTDFDLSGVRPGMTAVATLLDEEAAGGWLVPTSSVIERNGNTMVLVLRNGQPQPVRVTKVGTQGDWTIVESPELQAGDEAVGTVSSFINQDQNQGNNFRGGFGPGFGGGRPPGGNSGGR